MLIPPRRARGSRPGPPIRPGRPGGCWSRCPSSPAATPPRSIPPAAGSSTSLPRFTAADLEAAARTGDPVLAKTAAAAASAGHDGQVTQYLAGVPDLLDRYEGSGGDPYGQAVITAAMDAVRLGHASPLPAALIQEAAVGYLTGPQRTTSIESWRDTALAWAAEELKGAVRALQPVPPPSGTGVAGYQVADYLDQYGRRTRQDQLGPPSLWDALTARTASASDLTRLGQAARDRGLYRHAAALWTTAATLGSTDAARQLITHLRRVSPGDTTRAAQWAAGHASLDDPWGVACAAAGAGRGRGQRRGHRPGRPGRRPRQPRRPAGRRRAAGALGEAGASDAVTALLARDPPAMPASTTRGASPAAAGAGRGRGQRRGHRPGCPGRRPRQPRRPGGRRRAAARRWARPGPATRSPPWPARAAGHASLDDPRGVAALLRALGEAGASDAVTALAARAAGHASLDDPRGVAALLRALGEAGASDAVTTLLARDPAGHASLDDPGDVAGCWGAGRGRGQRRGHRPGRPGRRPRQPRRPVGRRRAAAGAGRGRGQRRGHRPAGPRPRRPRQPRQPGGRRRLLRALGEAGASDAVTALAARAAGHASLDDPGDVAALLQALGEAGASDAVTALAGPGPPATPASTTRGASPAAAGAGRGRGQRRGHRPGRPGRRPRQPRRPGGRRRAAAGAGRGRGQRRGHRPGRPGRRPRQPRRPGGRRRAAAGAARGRGQRRGHDPAGPRPAGHASLDDPGASPRCCGRWARPGPATRSPTLLARDPAGHASLDDPGAVAELLRALGAAGASDAVTALAARAANAGMFDLFLEVHPDEASSYLSGREPDGAPSQSWKWQEP